MIINRLKSLTLAWPSLKLPSWLSSLPSLSCLSVPVCVLVQCNCGTLVINTITVSVCVCVCVRVSEWGRRLQSFPKTHYSFTSKSTLRCTSHTGEKCHVLIHITWHTENYLVNAVWLVISCLLSMLLFLSQTKCYSCFLWSRFTFECGESLAGSSLTSMSCFKKQFIYTARTAWHFEHIFQGFPSFLWCFW